MRYYSKTTGCTYLSNTHAGQMPPDAVPISDARYLEVIGNPAPGKIRSHDAEGLPILTDPMPAPPPSRDQVEAVRLRAYADPITGSDRYFAEAQRESLMGNIDAAEIAKTTGIARFSKIQEDHPWPVG
ncbi:phage tail protein [Stutzerimonas stutzeri]|uniref:phage tail protein n=1 Tax=Stutzerimonas stutzeri TaxID=316 RepID=UPI0026586826|nr:phage tail protein [Stutzerimonas stutzeri]MCF6782315.1 phage tail protein [Stutzerimonas stutzeri]MCF6805363.1 phage tail protein [Stutzerimonas stutzeri]